MPEIDVNIDPDVFNDVYRPHLTNMARVQILYGGSSSGKSVFLAQRAIFDLLSGGRNYLICRAVARTVRRSVFNELQKIISEWGVSQLFHTNKSEGIITCENGYQILFAGLDDVEKIKSITPQQGAITDVWVEEATETNSKAVKQLFKRQRGGDANTPKRLTLSFNPIVKTHWIFKEYFLPIGWSDDQTNYEGDGLTILKTWYVHNKFLTAEDIHDLENEKDDYMKAVYTFGNWGVLGNLIFKQQRADGSYNWRVEDLSEMREEFDNVRHGLDFGFGVDPAAFTSTYYRDGRLYIFDEFAGTELGNDELAAMIKPRQDGLIYCDSAEPKSIAELRSEYGLRVIGAKKGKGSIEHGIKWLKRQEIIIDSSCVGVQNEFGLYSWKKNRYGESLPIPEDKNNHFIDGLRYQYEDMAQSTEVVLWMV